MTYRTSLNAKTTAESVTAIFEFGPQLAATSDSISSASTTAATYSGTDAAPSAVVSGAATISGTTVKQLLTAGTLGVTYLITCTAVTAAGQTVVQEAYLVVTP